MFKKIVSLVLVLVLSFSMSLVVFANHDLTQQSKVSHNNIMAESGYLEKDTEGNIVITEKYVDYIKNNLKKNGIKADVIVEGNTITTIEKDSNLKMESSSSSRSGGVTKVEWLSFNRFKIYLDNELSNKVAAGVGIGAALSVWIPEPLVSKIIASALGVSAGLIAYNNEGNGVIISGIYTFTPYPLATFYWIKSQ